MCLYLCDYSTCVFGVCTCICTVGCVRGEGCYVSGSVIFYLILLGQEFGARLGCQQVLEICRLLLTMLRLPAYMGNDHLFTGMLNN